MLFQLLQAGIDSTANAAAAAAATVPQVAQTEQTYSLIEMAVKGGWLMLVLLALSIIAIYIFGKKWWMLNRASQIDKNFMNDIRDYIHSGKVKSAITLCGKYDSPSARCRTSKPRGKTWATWKWPAWRRVCRPSPPSPAAPR